MDDRMDSKKTERAKDRVKGFFSEIYGMDALSFGLLLLSLLLNLIMSLVPLPVLNRFSPISLIPLLIVGFRFFSRSKDRRALENDRFVDRFFPGEDSERVLIREEKRQAREERKTEREQRKNFRFFTCPKCNQRLRVPKGKGMVEITCPNCEHKFVKKA